MRFSNVVSHRTRKIWEIRALKERVRDAPLNPRCGDSVLTPARARNSHTPRTYSLRNENALITDISVSCYHIFNCFGGMANNLCVLQIPSVEQTQIGFYSQRNKLSLGYHTLLSKYFIYVQALKFTSELQYSQQPKHV